ncbi:hypothetical protein [Kitasatospora paranensis]|uniref:Uncharacterized protein n=1 Tax=Kitasatospora paranensis TaxID=258053 RepID=A0ABW2G109_9ACTN
MPTTEITTSANRTLSVEITADAQGRSTYEVSLLTRDGTLTKMGSFVIHPDPRTEPKVGRVYIQFGKGDMAQRELRVDVPTIGPDGPFLVGEAIFDPSGMTPGDGLWLRSTVSAHPTHAPLALPSKSTASRAGDIVEAVVKHWLHREDYTALASTFGAFRAPDRLAAVQAKIAVLEAEIKARKLALEDLMTAQMIYETELAMADEQK